MTKYDPFATAHPQKSLFTPARIFFGLVSALALFTLYTSSFPTTSKPTADDIANMADSQNAGFLDNIDVALHQSGTSPPAVTVTVTNKNDHPITVLSYNSPLDGLAFKLGSLAITPSGASEPVKLSTIQIRRKWPPSSDSLISLEPGEKTTNELKLEGLTLSGDAKDKIGDAASVVMKGKYMAVWPTAKDSLTTDKLKGIDSDKDVAKGTYVSNTIDVSFK